MWIKRCTDIAISSLILILFSPVLIAAAVAVWLDSGSPILFRQERVGRGCSRFQIIKFRTMRAQLDAPLITVKGDGRITRVGKILRFTKLDEFPQFWNVLRGDMSVVGPRPEVPEFVELYAERFRAILRVRPGITDLASIHFRFEEAILAQSSDSLTEYKEHILPIKLDLADRYLKQQSIPLDLWIIARTALATLLGAAALQARPFQKAAGRPDAAVPVSRPDGKIR